MRSEKFQTGSKDSSSATAALIETIAMRFICLPNVEVWHRLPGAPLRNGVKGCSQEGHFDSERVAGCPPTSCSTFVGFGRISAELVSIKAWWPASSGCAFDESITP